MKKNILILLFPVLASGQIGIRTEAPKATLDITGKANDPAGMDGLIPPRIKGNDLKLKDNLYGTGQAGTIVFVTELPSPVTPKTTNIKSPGYYYYNAANGVWDGFREGSRTVTDAARFLGGTVYVKFNEVNNGSLANDRLISGSYSLGSLTGQQPKKGGIMSLNGNGYKISNPANGIFDIMFDTPYEEIYGVALNTLDAYGNGGGGVGIGTNPDAAWPGNRLNTKDNTQVAYLSNSVIRVKTGNSNGQLSNRTFTFIITGK